MRLKAAVGTEVGVSDWIEVTQDRINKFAEATCGGSTSIRNVQRQRCREARPLRMACCR